jgi:hypothetical protein
MGPADRLHGPAALIALSALCLLAGCAAFDFSEAECRAVNWYARGESDGFGGHPPQDLRLARQCARHGVAISQADYARGWGVGYDEHLRLKSMKCD